MCEVFAGQPKENYEPITRNLRLNGQSTSIRLERSFWDIIDSMASAEGVSTPSFLSTLQSEVIEIHGEAKNFTSLLKRKKKNATLFNRLKFFFFTIVSKNLEIYT